MTFKLPALLDSFPLFSWVMGFGLFAFRLFVVFRAFFDWVWGGSSQYFLSPAGTPPALCRASVRVFTSLSEAQDYRFGVFVYFHPADALLSPEPGGSQGALFAHNVVQDCICHCVLSFLLCVVFDLLVSAKQSSPSRGCRWCHLPFRVFVVSSSNPRHANGPREVFRMTSPLY